MDKVRSIEPRDVGDSNPRLVSGLLSDIEELFRQHIQLVKLELKQSFADGRGILRYLAFAAAFWFLGLLSFIVSLSLAVDLYTNIPAWASFGLVMVLCFLASWILSVIARNKMRSIDKKPLPEMTKALKEDVTWLSKTLNHRS